MSAVLDLSAEALAKEGPVWLVMCGGGVNDLRYPKSTLEWELVEISLNG